MTEQKKTADKVTFDELIAQAQSILGVLSLPSGMKMKLSAPELAGSPIVIEVTSTLSDGRKFRSLHNIGPILDEASDRNEALQCVDRTIIQIRDNVLYTTKNMEIIDD